LLSDAGETGADIGAGLALIGIATLTGQFAIDLAIGQLATTQADMSALLRQVSAAPGITLPFYLAGPIAFYAGLLILLTLLMRTDHVIGSWNGGVAIAGIVAVGVEAATGIAWLALLGYLGITVGLAPVAWQMFTEKIQ